MIMMNTKTNFAVEYRYGSMTTFARAKTFRTEKAAHQYARLSALKGYAMTTYSPIVKCSRHQCEHTERAGCLMCIAEDREIELARERAEDDAAITDTRFDAVDLMSRVASYRNDAGVSSWTAAVRK